MHPNYDHLYIPVSIIFQIKQIQATNQHFPWE